jgi:hypothetical protein
MYAQITPVLNPRAAGEFIIAIGPVGALLELNTATFAVSGSPAELGGLPRESIAGERRNHDVECVGCTSAMGRRVRERIDNLQLFHDRARPAVRDDQWQCLGVLRADVDEVNVDTVEISDELVAAGEHLSLGR